MLVQARPTVEHEGTPQEREYISYWWWCPGCDLERRMPGEEQGSGLHRFDDRWTFNGNLEAPTFRDSYLSRSQWGYKDGVRVDSYSTICHSFITDGMIQYLNDSTHPLAGQTVPMVPIPIEWADA